MLDFNSALRRVAVLALLFGLLGPTSFASPVTRVGSNNNLDVTVQLLSGIGPLETASSLFRRWGELSGSEPQQGLSEGFSRHPLWLRATLDRPATAQEVWWLVLSNALLDRVDIFLEQPDGSVMSFSAGDDLPRTQVSASTLLPSAPLRLAQGENRLLIRVESRNALATRIALRDARTMTFFEHRELFQGGLLAGTHLIAALAGLVIAIALRERVWMLFSVFVLISGVSLTFMLGLPGWFGLRAYPGMSDKLHGLVLVLSVAAVMDFIGRLTRAHQEYPRTYAILTRGAWLIVIPAGISILAGYFTEVILKLQFVVLIIAPVMVIMLWRQWRQGVVAAGYFLFGVGSYVAMSLVRVLRNLGLLPSAWWTEGLHEMMSITYLCVLAFGIATLSARALARREALEAELVAERAARSAERDFLAMLSHELRTPLATIEASSRLLQDVPNMEPAARGVRYDKIARAVGRLRDLFDRLLASDRLRSDWYPTALRPLDLVSFVQQVRDTSTSDRPGVDIRFEPPPGPAMVEADRSLIGIALGNLIGNALAYGPADRPIHLEVTPVSKGWRIAVLDSGPPVPPGEREALFGPYVRGARVSATPGAGLGLFIVMRIARLHSGNAGLDCPPTGGNRFWLEIPAISRDAPREGPRRDK